MKAESVVPVICIDGPGGVGKSTLAARLAQRLGWHRLDSGALYRIVAAEILDRPIDLHDPRAVAAFAANTNFRVEQANPVNLAEANAVRIRSERVGRAASTIAAYSELRTVMLSWQRAARRPPGLVADGRDMGTVVFPDAPLKIFLEALPEVRAKRRNKQLRNAGLNVSFRDLLADIRERDARDRERATAPLRPAEDAIVLDSTEMQFDDVFETVLSMVLERGPGLSGGTQNSNQRAV